MHRRICIFAALLFAAGAMQLAAQDDPPQAGRGGRGGGRGGRGSTREFLGLGSVPDAVAAARGEKLYAPNCAFCHGEKATGAEAPDLVRSALVLHDEKGELIGPLLLSGRPDKGMPAFASLTPAQVADIAQFLHMRVEAAANRSLYRVQDVVTGDAKAGQAYFNGAGQCNTCHSPTGDLAKVGTRYQPSALQTRFLYPGGRGGGGATEVIVTLASGQSIAGKLKRLDDFNISMYDSAGVYHSWPREGIKVEIKDNLVAHRALLGLYTDADMHNLLAYLVTLK